MAKVKYKARSHDLVCKDPHLTKQDHGGTASINEIAKRYADGALPMPEEPPMFYGDVSSLDVAQARNLYAEVQSAFADLPSDARDHFGNNAEAYVDWLNDNQAVIDEVGHVEAFRRTVQEERERTMNEFLEEIPPEDYSRYEGTPIGEALVARAQEGSAQDPGEAGATEDESGTQEHS